MGAKIEKDKEYEILGRDVIEAIDGALPEDMPFSRRMSITGYAINWLLQRIEDECGPVGPEIVDKWLDTLLDTHDDYRRGKEKADG